MSDVQTGNVTSKTIDLFSMLNLNFKNDDLIYLPNTIFIDNMFFFESIYFYVKDLHKRLCLFDFFLLNCLFYICLNRKKIIEIYNVDKERKRKQTDE